MLHTSTIMARSHVSLVNASGNGPGATGRRTTSLAAIARTRSRSLWCRGHLSAICLVKRLTAICSGRESCPVRVNNNYCDDPDGGTVKEMVVSYDCGGKAMPEQQGRDGATLTLPVTRLGNCEQRESGEVETTTAGSGRRLRSAHHDRLNDPARPLGWQLIGRAAVLRFRSCTE